MTTTIRWLVPGDEAIVEAHLASTPETTIFLRSNLSRAGLVDDGAQFSGTYAGAFEGERLAGVAAIFWNTNIVVGPGPHAERLAARAVELSGRSIGDTRKSQAAYLAGYQQHGHRAVLFTGETNIAAQRSYVAIGFREIGDYGIVFFAT